MNRFAWASVPLITVLLHEGVINASLLIEEGVVHRAPRANSMRPVEFHKYHLGRQDFCWSGEHRQWVWETKNWRVFVSNIRGISFEVKEGLTAEQARSAWDDYRRRILVLKIESGTLARVKGDGRPIEVQFPDARYGHSGRYIVTAKDGSGEQMSVAVSNILLEENT